MNRRAAGVALALLMAALGTAPPAVAAAGVRVVPLAALASREAFDTILSSAVASGDQSLLVPVGLFDDPPAMLAEMVSVARTRGLRVVAAVDVTRVAAANEWPASRDHVIYTHPEWLMVPRELALELSRLDVRSPDYAGRLARWARANAGKAMGLYLSPVHTDVAAFVAGAVRRLVERIPFDGVQFDTARYPSGDFDYSRLSLDELRREIRPGLSTDERRRLDEIETFDLLAYAKEFPDAWRRFRQTQLTALVVRARTAVKSVRPEAIVSAVVGSDPLAALSDYLQDWPTWLDNRFIDAVSVDAADVPGGVPSPALPPGR
ncbi:MAG TPA: family 10 glycosylhydrolase [Vicinamibacterales bacterium]|jgi:uncharacterized lipoprotein YddW (UPF0748 family)|nr:family 10 glycosylhydrolase [Vicinamibacterales bacterium]